MNDAQGTRVSSADPAWGTATFGSSGEELPAHVCAVEPGQVVLTNHSLFHSAYYHYPGRTFFAVKFAQQPTEDKHHASNMRYARDTYRARPLLLQHRDPDIRALNTLCSDPAVAAHAAAAFENAPWDEQEREFWTGLHDQSHGAFRLQAAVLRTNGPALPQNDGEEHSSKGRPRL